MQVTVGIIQQDPADTIPVVILVQTAAEIAIHTSNKSLTAEAAAILVQNTVASTNGTIPNMVGEA